jgi:hypothetical protein
VDVWGEHLIRDRVMHLSLGVLSRVSENSLIASTENGVTLKKLSLISWDVSRDFPVTGSESSVLRFPIRPPVILMLG